MTITAPTVSDEQRAREEELVELVRRSFDSTPTSGSRP